VDINTETAVEARLGKIFRKESMALSGACRSRGHAVTCATFRRAWFARLKTLVSQVNLWVAV
jgi:hypothetical protein